MIFVNFEKAFDSVDRESLWKILIDIGIPEIIIINCHVWLLLIAIIIAMYEVSKCCIKTPEGQTCFFRILSGVKQGCVLSPLHFVILLDYILRNSETGGIRLSL